MKPDSGSIAVSLHYDGNSAPKVSAKGEGDVAKRILELATEHDIPIYQNAELLQLLSQVDLDTEIPPELYIAVAEIIAFAYRLKDRVPAAYDHESDSGAVYNTDDIDTGEFDTGDIGPDSNQSTNTAPEDKEWEGSAEVVSGKLMPSDDDG